MSSRTNRLIIWGSVALGALLLAAAIAYVFWMMPPREFSILVGREGGAYYEAAQAYKEVAAEKGFTLNIIPTAGSVETLERLQQGEAGIGFVQGGAVAASNGEADAAELRTMASVFYEPLWIFYRSEVAEGIEDAEDGRLTRLNQLAGLRVNLGEAGSGTEVLARLLLEETGVSNEDATFSNLPSGEAAEALANGEIDVAFFVLSPTAGLIRELMAQPETRLMDLTIADGYALRHDYLSVLELPAGTINPATIEPDVDIDLLSTVANLVIHEEFHQDLMRLMTIAIVRVHRDGGIFEEPGEFPNTDYAELPVDPREQAYIDSLKDGESWLDNYLPFWAAALVDRYLLFVLPIFLLLVPIISRAPLVLQMITRLRINRWYKRVREIELEVDQMDVAGIDDARRQLEGLDNFLARELDVSDNYMPDVYNLREHIGYIMTKLQRRKATVTGEPLPAATVDATPVEGAPIPPAEA